MVDLVSIAKVVGQQDPAAFDTCMGAAGDECDKIFSQLTAGKARLLRALLKIEQPRAHMPEPARPQIPEVRIDETCNSDT